MKKLATLVVLGSLLALASPASADLFRLEADAQATYTRLGNVHYRVGSESPKVDLAGFGVGGRAALSILFITAVFDYQHLFPGADFIHAGLGVSFRFDSIPVITPYVSASLGLIALDAQARMFPGQTGSDSLVDNELGFQGRAGGGLEFTFASDWLALGVGADIGAHYLTGDWGYDLSINLHFGLRI